MNTADIDNLVPDAHVAMSPLFILLAELAKISTTRVELERSDT